MVAPAFGSSYGLIKNKGFARLQFRRAEYLRLRKEQGICGDEFYHFDTPLTVDHEKEALLAAGFSSVTVLGNWGPTYTLKAVKGEIPAICNSAEGYGEKHLPRNREGV